MEQNNKVLLSIKDLHVKFRVRGRILTAIRGISLDLYENESIAIVGESGSGKSVFTKTFAGMLDANGYISQGSIIFDDEELAKTVVALTPFAKRQIVSIVKKLNKYSKYESVSSVYNSMEQLKQERQARLKLTDEEEQKFSAKLKELLYKKTQLFNEKQTVDPSKEKARIKELNEKIEGLSREIEALEAEKKALLKQRMDAAKKDSA